MLDPATGTGTYRHKVRGGMVWAWAWPWYTRYGIAWYEEPTWAQQLTSSFRQLPAVVQSLTRFNIITKACSLGSLLRLQQVHCELKPERLQRRLRPRKLSGIRLRGEASIKRRQQQTHAGTKEMALPGKVIHAAANTEGRWVAQIPSTKISELPRLRPRRAHRARLLPDMQQARSSRNFRLDY